MESIRRLIGTTLQPTTVGYTLTLWLSRDGSKARTIYNITAGFELLEKLQRVQAALMPAIGEELGLFEFERHPDGVTLRLRTKSWYSLNVVMTDVVEHVPVVNPAW